MRVPGPGRLLTVISKWLLLCIVFPTNFTNALQPTGTQLQVVYAGLGRSGTHSLSAALTRIGYKTCHGENIARNLLDNHAELGQAAMDHDVDQILEITERMGYNATLEIHGAFWREILTRRPNAKYIFLPRDFDSWYPSLMAVYGSLAPLGRYPLRSLPLHDQLFRFFAAWSAFWLHIPMEEALEFMHNPTNDEYRELLLSVHHQFEADMREALLSHPENTLLLDLKAGHGYPELCQFLQVDDNKCPNEPFPRVHSRAMVTLTTTILLLVEALMYTTPFLVVCLVWKIYRCCFKPSTYANVATKKKN